MFVLLLACSATPSPATESSAQAAPTPKSVPAPPLAPAVEAKGHAAPGKRRLVAIGDLHGDRMAALEVLQLAGVSGREGHWTGGDTVFVQTGDLTDRGPDSKGVLDLLRTLQTEAPNSGGEVHLLNGNHEVMNLQGDWRYVSTADIEGFGGRVERLSAFAQTGKYGQFLAELPMVVKVDDTVFVHGGVHPDFAKLGVDGINELAKRHYFDPLETRAPINGDRGPIWFRGYARAPESVACPLLADALKMLGAKRMVVGHTTTKGSMNVRCGGALTVIDVGISANYGHHLGAWESIDGDARSLLPTGVVDIVDP